MKKKIKSSAKPSSKSSPKDSDTKKKSKDSKTSKEKKKKEMASSTTKSSFKKETIVDTKGKESPKHIGKSKIDAIEVSGSVSSIAPTPTPQINLKKEYLTLEDFPNDYGHEWTKEEMNSLDMLPNVNDVTKSNILLLLDEKADLKRESTRFYDIPFSRLKKLWYQGCWVSDTVLNAFYDLLNEKELEKAQHNPIYFHNSYQYQYVTNPQMGKVGSADYVKKFPYPNGKTFFDYNKLVFLCNQKDEHWSICVFDN
jgi:hypothetical protein